MLLRAQTLMDLVFLGWMQFILDPTWQLGNFIVAISAAKIPLFSQMISDNYLLSYFVCMSRQFFPFRLFFLRTKSLIQFKGAQCFEIPSSAISSDVATTM